MGIVSSKFNWVSTPSAYDQVSNWRAKQKAFNSQIESNLASMSYVFADTAYALSTGMAEIAAKKAALRVASELDTKIKAAQLDTTV